MQQVRARIRNARSREHRGGLPKLPLDGPGKEAVRLRNGGIEPRSHVRCRRPMRLVRPPERAGVLRAELKSPHAHCVRCPPRGRRLSAGKPAPTTQSSAKGRGRGLGRASPSVVPRAAHGSPSIQGGVQCPSGGRAGAEPISAERFLCARCRDCCALGRPGSASAQAPRRRPPPDRQSSPWRARRLRDRSAPRSACTTAASPS